MQTSPDLLEVIVVAHTSKLPSISVVVTHEDKPYKFNGRSTDSIEFGHPTVALLQKHSTPEKREINKFALNLFKSATAGLVKDGGKFYTQLHPKQIGPVFEWRRA